MPRPRSGVRVPRVMGGTFAVWALFRALRVKCRLSCPSTLGYQERVTSWRFRGTHARGGTAHAAERGYRACRVSRFIATVAIERGEMNPARSMSAPCSASSLSKAVMYIRPLRLQKNTERKIRSVVNIAPGYGIGSAAGTPMVEIEHVLARTRQHAVEYLAGLETRPVGAARVPYGRPNPYPSA